MEGFFFLLGCLLLAFPILAIVALVKTIGLSARLGSIERRMAAMESQQPHRAPTAAAAPPIPAAPPITPYAPEEPYAPRNPTVESAQAPAMPPSPERQATVTPPIAPQPAPSPPTISFEERLG